MATEKPKTGLRFGPPVITDVDTRKTKGLNKRDWIFTIPSGAVLNDYGEYVPSYSFSSEFGDIRRALNKRNHTVVDANIPYRMINHWDENGLLATTRKNKKGWRKFSFVELAWIKIVEHLRNYGMPLEKIAKAKAKVMRSNGKELYQHFEFYLFAALFSSTDPYVAVLADGTADVSAPAEVEFFRPVSEQVDMLIIPLRRILKEIGIDVPDVDPHTVVNMKEKELQKSIYFEGNKEVLVKIKNNDIHEIETKKVVPQNPRLREIQLHIQQGHMFGETTTRFEGGKAQSVEIKRRKRFDG